MTSPTVSQWVSGRRQVPAERCPEIEKVAGGLVRCEDLRPDVDWAYLRGTNCPVPEPRQEEAAPVRALACATQSVRLTADRRDADRRELARRAEPVAAPQPDQLPLALDAGADKEAA